MYASLHRVTGPWRAAFPENSHQDDTTSLLTRFGQDARGASACDRHTYGHEMSLIITLFFGVTHIVLSVRKSRSCESAESRMRLWVLSIQTKKYLKSSSSPTRYLLYGTRTDLLWKDYKSIANLKS